MWYRNDRKIKKYFFFFSFSFSFSSKGIFAVLIERLIYPLSMERLEPPSSDPIDRPHRHSPRNREDPADHITAQPSGEARCEDVENDPPIPPMTPYGKQQDGTAGLDALEEYIETIRAEREQRESALVAKVQQLDEELFAHRQANEALRLQLHVQESEAQRFRKENAVFHSQLNELREQLAVVGELSWRRGKALQAAGLPLPTVDVNQQPSQPQSPVGATVAAASGSLKAPYTFNLRKKAKPSVQAPLSLPSAASPFAAPGDVFLSPSAKSEGPSVDYNDLVPVTKDQLDPELMAALNPSSRPTTVPQVIALTEEVQLLRQHMESQRCAYEEERMKRQAEERRVHRQFAEEREVFARNLKRLEEINECCLRDLVACKRLYGPRLQAAEMENASLKVMVRDALDATERVRREKTYTVAHAESKADTKFKKRLADLHQQIVKMKERWEDERQRLIDMVEEKHAKAEKLEKEVTNLKAKLQRETRRFRLEREGGENELQQIRNSLRLLEQKLLFTKAREEATVEGLTFA